MLLRSKSPIIKFLIEENKDKLKFGKRPMYFKRFKDDIIFYDELNREVFRETDNPSFIIDEFEDNKYYKII